MIWFFSLVTRSPVIQILSLLTCCLIELTCIALMLIEKYSFTLFLTTVLTSPPIDFPQTLHDC